mgnify:CR=1 FL=1
MVYLNYIHTMKLSKARDLHLCVRLFSLSCLNSPDVLLWLLILLMSCLLLQVLEGFIDLLIWDLALRWNHKFIRLGRHQPITTWVVVGRVTIRTLARNCSLLMMLLEKIVVVVVILSKLLWGYCIWRHLLRVQETGLPWVSVGLTIGNFLEAVDIRV